MAPFYKISVHEKDQRKLFLKISIDKKITFKWHVMWYYNSQPWFQDWSQIGFNYQNLILLKWGLLLMIHQIYNFGWKIERFLCKNGKKILVFSQHYIIAIYHKSVWYVPPPPHFSYWMMFWNLRLKSEVLLWIFGCNILNMT